jgi:hypothetical protein
MWQNIPPHHDIFSTMCQGIFFQYYLDVNTIFQKIFNHVHLLTLMLPRSPFSIPIYFLRRNIFAMNKIHVLILNARGNGQLS